MIGMTEYIIFFSAMGNLTMSYAFNSVYQTFDKLLLLVALIYFFLPTDKISQFLFKIDNNEAPVSYDVACLNFDTDYDRENPVLKRGALSAWNEVYDNIYIISSNLLGVMRRRN
jgi:hypothetical protein